MEHDRFVYKVTDPNTRLGWTPYNFRATKGAVSQWACHTEDELTSRLSRHGLKIVKWSDWRDGVRTTRLEAL